MIESNPFVVIGMISYRGEIHPSTALCLDRLISESRRAGIGLAVKKRSGSIIPKNRNEICDDLLECEQKYGVRPTHLLFVDSDMLFDPDALIRLLKFDRDIVGGLAVNRGAPYLPVVKKKDKDGNWETYAREPLREGRFITDADGTGCAFLLIKRGVFEKLKKPYFAMPPIGESIMGEDIYFCEKAKQAGFDICIDSSLIIGHIAEQIVTLDTYFEYRAERDARESKESG